MTIWGLRPLFLRKNEKGALHQNKHSLKVVHQQGASPANSENDNDF